MDNPLLELSTSLPFDRIRPDHVEPAVNRLVADAEARIQEIIDEAEPRSYANTIGSLEEATHALEKAMGVVGHLESVATTPSLRDAYNACLPKVSAFYASIPTNSGLWTALKDFSRTDEASDLDPVRRRLLDKTIREFRRHGAELEESGKAELRGIDEALTQVTNRFGQNTLDATNAFELYVHDEGQLSGLPATAKEAARESATAKGEDGWRFTLQAPSLIPALTYLDDSALRESLWRAYNTRATGPEHDNRAILPEILRLRRRKAQILSFSDFSDLVLADRMAQRGEKAQDFVDDLRERCERCAKVDHATLIEFRRGLDGAEDETFNPWDVSYYADKLRRERYNFDQEELRPYFPVDTVLHGAFSVVQRLYGVRVEEHDMPAWDDAVKTFALRSEADELLGTFYVDLYPRENKRGGAWMNALVTRLPDDPRHSHHVGLFCANFTPPGADRPALLTHREVETLFHEFGHLMHHLLTTVEVRSLAGTAVAWDFVELPSQIMENWCWEREALDLFACHFETGESIPNELYEKLNRTRTFRAGSHYLRQMTFATLDLALHREFDPNAGESPIEYALEIFRKLSPTWLPNDYAMVASFGHLFSSPVGYAAAYYSYAWAEVLDADAYSRFRDEGIFNPATGRDFRKLLASGNSQDPLDLFENFMGREPQIDALLTRSGLNEVQ